MRRRTPANLMPPSRSAPLLVALAVLGLVGVSHLGDACESASRVSERQGLGGVDIEAKDLPKWWLPLSSPVEAGPGDGTLCGFGVRLARGYFLAHTKAVNRIVELSSQSGKKAGMFRFAPETTIDVAAPLLRDDIYEPTLTDTFEGDIGLYRADIRQGAGPGAQPVHMRYPLWSSVCLEVDKDANQKNCRLLTYGDDDIGGDGPWPNGTRRLKMIGVEEIGCNDTICYMLAASLGGKWDGLVCGSYSNLGSPIICGDGPLEKVTYFFWRMYHNGTGIVSRLASTNCTDRFRAVKVAHIARRVWNTHTSYMQS